LNLRVTELERYEFMVFSCLNLRIKGSQLLFFFVLLLIRDNKTEPHIPKPLGFYFFLEEEK